MFSVLIMNKKTTESFNEYYPLFLDAIKRNDVAVCRWYESGSDIASALPDLHDLTDDKKEWRAIIVKVEDDLDAHPYFSENPFDYVCNSDEAETLSESPIPLIRLTHYLGGFPAPDVHFFPQEVQNEGKATRVIYKPCRNQQNEELYEQLSEKYSFDGHHPSEIVLFTLRQSRVSDSVNSIKTAWTDYVEINSSNFWKRNNYPSNCRFIVFDLSKEGPVQREADMFSFWTSIVLLSTNSINPNCLQAYRLYKISVDFSKSNMEEDLQSTVTHLIGSRHYIEQSIQKDIENKLNEEKNLPNYEVNIPVTIDAPKKTRFGINAKRFPLTPSSVIEDNVLWSNMKIEALEAVDECIENSEMALDKSACTMRQVSEFPEDSIKPLDAYQKKEMESDLSNIYSKIIMTQGLLPKTSVQFQEKLVEKEDRVKKNFIQRITGTLSVQIISFVAMFLLVGFVPAAYCYAVEGQGKIENIVAIFAISVVIVGLIELFVLLFQKSQLNSYIESYNDGLQSAVGELKNNSKIYSNFISSIASYIKGKSYLNKLSKMKFEDDNSYKMQRRHIKAINSLLTKIKRWATAFNLNVSFDVNDEINFVIDYAENPQFNSTYTFASKGNKKVSVNKSGDYIDSQFDFINQLNLEREELYDEYRN